MILRALNRPTGTSADSEVKPASEVFIGTQKQVHPPFAIVLQATHSKLAGDLALLLREEVFGTLPTDVIRAISEHDWGWQRSDEGQIDLLATREPRPFPRLSVEETLPSWDGSIAHAAQLGPLGEVMVSRHFTLLGASDPARAGFVQNENQRRAKIEATLPYSKDELARWTAAIGFCDLLSLYLCCGSNQPVEFPLAHPADPAASDAPHVRLSWDGDTARFSIPIVKPDAVVSLEAKRYQGTGTNLIPMTITWRFKDG